jgi:glycosyltransferase involved in cell wall biosynthesis
MELLVQYLSNVDSENDWYIFVSKTNRTMFSGVINPRFNFILCGESNEHLLRRILSEQFILPFKARNLRLDVMYFLGDVCPLVNVCPYVVKLNTFHHYTQPEGLGNLRRTYRRLLCNSSAHRAAKLIANSMDCKDDAVRFTQVSAPKVAVVDEAIDPRFTVGQPGKIIISGRTVASEFVLFVSLLYRHKNVASLIRAFSIIVRTHRLRHSLVIAGRDAENLLPELSYLAAKLGVQDRVVFLGRVPFSDLVSLYQSAALFVYPSLSETFGKPPLEAMACGCPVAASSVGSIPEVLGNAAMFFNPESVSDIADKMLAVLQDRTLRETLVRSGLERVRRFSWDRVAKETLAILQESAAHHDKDVC